MIKKIFLPCLCLFISMVVFSQDKPLTSGMKITKNTRIKKGVYRLDGIPGKTDKGVILIQGDYITIDFNNATLHGSTGKKNPDEFFGVAVLIRDCKNVTIRNLKAKGYKIALLAINVESLTLENCDLSYNYRPNLQSTQEKEDIADWMSYHHNENDEWLRYGAAMYLKNCNLAIIRNCKVTGGQNALMMTASNGGLIYNNDFSFNSGIGIGMYRSSRNRIAFNKINFNVRGYSHGVFNRGQDSAGILVYEQSNDNLFYNNSVTHGGDGFFLWAGQYTMDTGKGGCNGNVLLSNDFSYAPTNGIEVTFSSNKIVNNRIYGCDHGIWGGYSYNTDISNNKFRDNRIAIAIEHGQDNTIRFNLFSRDKEAIRLWARRQQPPDWGYAKYRDTRSRNYTIVSNSFYANEVVANISRTDNVNMFDNRFGDENPVFKIDSTVIGFDTAYNEEIFQRTSVDSTIETPYIVKPIDPFQGAGAVAGRKHILITEWGPHDFRSPIIWNTNPVDSSDLMRFDIIGPKGRWKLRSARGVDSISAKSGSFPAVITARKKKGERTDIQIDLEYTGSSAITTPFGVTVPAGKPYIFTYKKYFQPISWTVRWFAFDSLSNPVKTGMLFPENARLMPVKTDTIDRIEYAWWGGIKVEEQVYPQFITLAEGEATVPKGVYELGVTWDDAVRVYVDNKLVLDEWNPSLYKFDESPHKKVRLSLGGKHSFRVEHVELGGFATLSLRLKQAR